MGKIIKADRREGGIFFRWNDLCGRWETTSVRPEVWVFPPSKRGHRGGWHVQISGSTERYPFEGEYAEESAFTVAVDRCRRAG